MWRSAEPADASFHEKQRSYCISSLYMAIAVRGSALLAFSNTLSDMSMHMSGSNVIPVDPAVVVIVIIIIL